MNEKGPEGHPVAIGARPHNEITFGHFALIPRGQYEIFAAFASVGTGDADVGDPAIPEIINESEDHGWNLDDQWPFMGVEPDEAVDSVVVGGQLHRLGVHQVFPDDVRVVLRAEAALRGAHTCLVHDREAQQVSLQRTRPIQVVIDFVGGFRVRDTVRKVERSNGGFHLVRYREARRNGCRHLVLLLGRGA